MFLWLNVDSINGCEEVKDIPVWGFDKNNYAYINSKFRLDNLINLSNYKYESSDSISALKILLRTGKKHHVQCLVEFLKLSSPSKMKKEFNEIIKKIEADKTCEIDFPVDNLKKFLECIILKKPDCEKACEFSEEALNELETYEKEKELKQERFGSYIIDDYSQIITSSAFRRLQDKAQVFSLEKADFIRSRLTHSNEVASNCEIMANYIDFNKVFNNKGLQNDCYLILRCAGLIHDIGNPPFGHYGEDIIKHFFEQKKDVLKIANIEDFLKFDGNAQSLRVVTKLQYFGIKRSLCLSASVLGAIIKYPFPSDYDYGEEKFGYFKSEETLINGLRAAGVFRDYYRNPMAILLEASDDISYFTADLEDAIHKGIITKNSFKKFQYSGDKKTKEFYSKIKELNNDMIDEYLEIKGTKKKMPKKSTSSKEERRIFEIAMRPIISKLRQDLLVACAKQFVKDQDRIIKKGINIKQEKYELLKEVNEYKELKDNLKSVIKTCYSSMEVVNPELQGHRILTTILEEYFNAIKEMKFKDGVWCWDEDDKKSKYYEKIMSYVSKDFFEVFEIETAKIKLDDNNREELINYHKMHLLVDFVSGMTDSYAESIYDLFLAIK